MKHVVGAFAVLGSLMLVQPALAQDSANLPDEKAADVKIQIEAMGALDKMATHLRTLTSFTLVSETTQDNVLEGGEKVEIAGRTTYRVRKPDRMVLEVVTDRKNRQYFYDGKTVTQFAPELGYYAVFEAADTILKTLDIAVEKYDVELPLADLFYWGTERSNVKEVNSAYFVGEANIGGEICNHYAYRAKAVDFQVWIRKQGDPLPCKLAVTDREIEVRPKYSATLSWQIGTEFPDDTFTFVPGEGAMKIDMEVVKAGN